MKNYSKEIEAFARFWLLWRYGFNKCRRLYGLFINKFFALTLQSQQSSNQGI